MGWNISVFLSAELKNCTLKNPLLSGPVNWSLLHRSKKKRRDYSSLPPLTCCFCLDEPSTSSSPVGAMASGSQAFQMTLSPPYLLLATKHTHHQAFQWLHTQYIDIVCNLYKGGSAVNRVLRGGLCSVGPVNTALCLVKQCIGSCVRGRYLHWKKARLHFVRGWNPSEGVWCVPGELFLGHSGWFPAVTGAEGRQALPHELLPARAEAEHAGPAELVWAPWLDNRIIESQNH